MKRRLRLLDEIPKGDAEAAVSLAAIKERVDYLAEYGSTRIDSLRTGTTLYNKFVEFRTIIAASYNTIYMNDIVSEIEAQFPEEYSEETLGAVTPGTIKSYLVGFTANVTGGPSRENLPISVGSIPPMDEWTLPIKNILLYDGVSISILHPVEGDHFAYLYVPVTTAEGSEPTITSFAGFNTSDITSLKDLGIETVQLWGHKNGTRYTLLMEGTPDELPLASFFKTFVVVGIVFFILIITVYIILKED